MSLGRRAFTHFDFCFYQMGNTIFTKWRFLLAVLQKRIKLMRRHVTKRDRWVIWSVWCCGIKNFNWIHFLNTIHFSFGLNCLNFPVWPSCFWCWLRKGQGYFTPLYLPCPMLNEAGLAPIMLSKPQGGCYGPSENGEKAAIPVMFGFFFNVMYILGTRVWGM